MSPATFFSFLVLLPLPHCALLKLWRLLISVEIQVPPQYFLSPNQLERPQLHPSIQIHLYLNLLKTQYKLCFILFHILSPVTSSWAILFSLFTKSVFRDSLFLTEMAHSLLNPLRYTKWPLQSTLIIAIKNLYNNYKKNLLCIRILGHKFASRLA